VSGLGIVCAARVADSDPAHREHAFDEGASPSQTAGQPSLTLYMFTPCSPLDPDPRTNAKAHLNSLQARLSDLISLARSSGLGALPLASSARLPNAADVQEQFRQRQRVREGGTIAFDLLRQTWPGRAGS
jgi:hypothetical protein